VKTRFIFLAACTSVFSFWFFASIAMAQTSQVTHTGGSRKILLINKCDRPSAVSLAGVKEATQARVDEETNFSPAISENVKGGKPRLRNFGVSVITLTQ